MIRKKNSTLREFWSALFCFECYFLLSGYFVSTNNTFERSGFGDVLIIIALMIWSALFFMVANSRQKRGKTTLSDFNIRYYSIMPICFMMISGVGGGFLGRDVIGSMVGVLLALGSIWVFCDAKEKGVSINGPCRILLVLLSLSYLPFYVTGFIVSPFREVAGAAIIAMAGALHLDYVIKSRPDRVSVSVCTFLILLFFNVVMFATMIFAFVFVMWGAGEHHALLSFHSFLVYFPLLAVLVSSTLFLWLLHYFLGYLEKEVTLIDLLYFFIGGVLLFLVYVGFLYSVLHLGKQWVS